MGIKDFFKRKTERPKPLAPEQFTEPATPKPFRRPRKAKSALAKQIDRIPEENEDARARLERLAKWKTRADRAEKVRRDWETQFEVERCERYFLGQQWDRSVKQPDLVLNHFLATIKVITPNLLFSQPKYFIRPRPGRVAPAGDLRAAMGEGVLDFIGGQDQNLKRTAKLAVLQAFFRLGAMKTVYNPRLEPNPCQGEPMGEHRAQHGGTRRAFRLARTAHAPRPDSTRSISDCARPRRTLRGACSLGTDMRSTYAAALGRTARVLVSATTKRAAYAPSITRWS